MEIRFACLLALSAALATACGGSVGTGPADASTGSDAASSVDSSANPGADSGHASLPDSGPLSTADAGSDSSAPSTCGTGSVTGSCVPFTPAVVAVATVAGGGLHVTIADSQTSACSTTGQSLTIVLPPGGAAGTFTIVDMTDGGALPASEAAVSYTMFFPEGGGTSFAQSGTVTLTSVSALGVTGSFQATFATTACEPSTISGTFSGLASCRCP